VCSENETLDTGSPKKQDFRVTAIANSISTQTRRTLLNRELLGVANKQLSQLMSAPSRWRPHHSTQKSYRLTHIHLKFFLHRCHFPSCEPVQCVALKFKGLNDEHAIAALLKYFESKTFREIHSHYYNPSIPILSIPSSASSQHAHLPPRPRPHQARYMDFHPPDLEPRRPTPYTRSSPFPLYAVGSRYCRCCG